MKLFSFLIRQSPLPLSLAVLAGILGGVASAAIMAIINSSLAKSDRTNTLAMAFAGVAATVLLSNIVSRLLLLRISSRAVMRMRMDLCSQLLVTPLREVEDHGSPRLMAALTEDILAVSDTLAQFPILCVNLAILIACFTYLWWLSWPLGILYTACFAFGVLTYEWIEWPTRKLLAQGREKWDALIGHYEALIHGNKELKLHQSRREAFFAEALRPTAVSMQTLAYGWHSRFAIAAVYGEIFYFVVIGIVLFVAPRVSGFNANVLTGFTLLTIYINGPLSFLVGTFPAFQRADVALEKIESLGLSLANASPSDIKIADSPHPQRPFSGIEVRSLKYTYHREDEDRTFTLGPIDLNIRRGELIFITGGNGSGKSSFARLITGLYVPEEGEIIFSGDPVTNENRDHYRQHFSAVFSDYYLFDTMFGLLSESAYQRVSEYLEKLRLTHKVQVVHGKFSTTSLSQGQRKRLALLISFIEDRDIYLFDEWAADQDATFKVVFYHQIVPELKAKGKTVLVISHDEQFYHVADRILRFADGQIIEDRTENLRDAEDQAIFQVHSPHTA